MFYAVRIPAWFIKLNRNCVWKIPSKEKVLYLTFDDGPHETATPFVLDQLKKYNAKATFFCIGKNVQAYPEIYERIFHEGHKTGNHTFNHINGWKVSKEKYINDVNEAAKLINSKFFRPPYGKISLSSSKIIRNQLEYKIIMWHVLSADFDEKISPQKCLENVLQNSEEGSIIVFHDSSKAWRSLSFALPEVLSYFGGKNFQFKALP